MDQIENPAVSAEILMVAAQGVNIAELLDDAEVNRIGGEAVRLYRLDKESMKPWRDRMDRGIKLATLDKEEKTYPWTGAANVKYPLITTAALQFNARAYPAIVAQGDMVKTRIHGQDPQGLSAARGFRVATHMSWQLSSRIDEWEEETDRLLVMLPIVGTMIRKWWWDPVEGRPRCRLVQPGLFIVNDKVKSLRDAPRVSEELELFPDEIMQRRRAGIYRDVEYVEDEDAQAPETFIEHHCRLDLDRDGYEEPYIVTVHVASGLVARIVADFALEDIIAAPDGRVVSIKRQSYYVATHFLPSIDGGFWGVGLGLLLGDISDTVNSLINMLIDAGHMSSLGGGFLGSEFRIKGGSQRFRPGEWKLAQQSGSEIRNSVVPMTFPGPDATLFQLLGLLIEAGREVSSVKDIMTGDTGAKTMTATTTLALIEQGMAVFTAAYKRIFRAMKEEFKLLAKLNAQFLSAEEYQQLLNVPADPRADYAAQDLDIEPVADPRSVTKMQEAAKAQLVLQMADSGLVDRGEAAKRAISAASIPDVEALMPKPNPAQQAMEQMQMQAAQADLAIKMVGVDQALADLEKTRSETMKNMSAAASADHQMRIAELKARLEVIREGLAQALGGRPGTMAGFPGGVAGQGGPVAVAGYPPQGGNGSLLVGQGMA